MQQKRGRRFEHLFTKIAKRFNEDFSIVFDYTGIETLQDKRDAQLLRIQNHIMNGMRPADAYAYEGLADAPISEDAEPAVDEEIIEEEAPLEEALSFDTVKKKMGSGISARRYGTFIYLKHMDRQSEDLKRLCVNILTAQLNGTRGGYMNRSHQRASIMK